MNERIERFFNRLRGDNADPACIYEYIQRLEAAVRTLAPDDGDALIEYHAETSIEYAQEAAEYEE